LFYIATFVVFKHCSKIIFARDSNLKCGAFYFVLLLVSSRILLPAVGVGVLDVAGEGDSTAIPGGI
jgi:hypothetical protein